MARNFYTNLKLFACTAAAIFFGLLMPCSAQTHNAELDQLNRKALELYGQREYRQATDLTIQIIALTEKLFGPSHLLVASGLDNLAHLYNLQLRYVEAEPIYKRSIAIREKTLGQDHTDVANSLNSLGSFYTKQARFAEAEQFFIRALKSWEKALGPNHSNVSIVLNNLAFLYSSQAQYPQAETLYKRALAIKEKTYGADHPEVALSLNNLAEIYRMQAQYSKAEPMFKQSIAIREKAFGYDNPSIASSLNNLAAIYFEQSQYNQAESIFKRLIAIQENALGPDHPSVAQTLHNLAVLYHRQGKMEQAESLYKRSLTINEKAYVDVHPSIAVGLNSLGDLYRDKAQFSLAEPLHKRALSIREKIYSLDHPEVADSLVSLADTYNNQELYSQAEPLYKRSLAIREKALSKDHPDIAEALNNLGKLYFYLGQYAEAEQLFMRAFNTWEKVLGPNHPKVAAVLNNLGLLYGDIGQNSKALPFFRRASAVYRNRIVEGGANDNAVIESFKNQIGFSNHLYLLLLNPNKVSEFDIANESLEIVQLAQATGTASAISKMTSRFSQGNDELASLVKNKQDAIERIVKQEQQLINASSKPPQQRNLVNEQQLRDQIKQNDKEVSRISTDLSVRFPKFAELTRQEPLSVRLIQNSLKPNEAMLVYFIGGKSFVWVVTPNATVFLRLQVDEKNLALQVKAIRSQMDFDKSGTTMAVNVTDLHELHQNIFAPVKSYLKGVSHVIVVPAGPLQSLPFGMLVASPPPVVQSDAEYRRVDWLTKQYAFSVLPSVGSIRAFRQLNKQSSAQQPFIGFGDPLVGARSGSTRGKTSKIDISGVFRSLGTSINTKDLNSLHSDEIEIADVESIRKLTSLPETADEIKSMAKVLKASDNSIWLGSRATESNIKSIDLTLYRTIAFATHGVMAGQLKGVGEPGLILTPPKRGTVEDDGYLSSSEIAKLRLNADWVILAACNTAAANGTPGAEGLSGLAKAFFYAGARSLLVSHWPVDSEATVALTTGMLREYEKNPTEGKAEAQRKSMLSLMNSTNNPEFSHPVFWAPFVVVGEAGKASP
jgi:CHAT domain-containing protein/Tfp pilus assembly protein PilF